MSNTWANPPVGDPRPVNAPDVLTALTAAKTEPATLPTRAEAVHVATAGLGHWMGPAGWHPSIAAAAVDHLHDAGMLALAGDDPTPAVVCTECPHDVASLPDHPFCGNAGPRIGEGRPRCVREPGHDGRHKAHPSWNTNGQEVTW